MSRLSSLFEEDIEMQDALEDIETLTDDSEDIIISNIEERYNEIRENEVHLFTNEVAEPAVDDPNLTEEEEAEYATAIMNMQLDKEDDEPLDVEDVEDFLDDDEY